MLRSIREYYDRYHDCAIVSRKLGMDIHLVRQYVRELTGV